METALTFLGTLAGKAVVGSGVLGLVGFFVWPILKKKVPPYLADQLGKAMFAGLSGAGLKDPDIVEWLEGVTFHTVVLCEKKFPDAGLGQERFKLAAEFLCRTFPWLAPFLASQGDNLADLINRSVVAMDAKMKETVAKGEPKPPAP